MITVASDVPLRLQEYLRTIAPERTQWRAVTCYQPQKLSSVTTANLKTIVSGIVVQHLAGQDGAVFIINEHDILVLCRLASAKTLNDLASDFNAFFVAVSSGQSDICSVYDLSVAWDALGSWVAEKLASPTPPAVPVPEVPAKISSLAAVNKIILEKTISGKIPSHRAQRKTTLVLLVEDDPISMRLARRTLSGEYQVVEAADGSAAREAYAFNAPTITFLDIGLPDISGHDVLKEIQILDANAYVVMLSANSYQKDIIKAMHLGAKGFICKPFTVAKLKHYISQAESHFSGQSVC